MADQETWDTTVAMVADEFSRLPAECRLAVADAARAIKACKTALYAAAAAVDAGAVCVSCGGACCRTGKYHFTVVDLLVYLAGAQELFVPRFGQEACPYLGSRGCMMAPPYRPLTCVIFNCDRIESRLEPLQKEQLLDLENELRGYYAGLEELFGRRFMGGVLMNGEQAGLTDERAILHGANVRAEKFSTQGGPHGRR